LPPEETLMKTALHACHREAGGRLVPFAGWEMPVQYRGVVEEHLAVRTRAGLFDVSHMGEIEIRGHRALALVQKLTSNDAGRLVDGQAQYSGLTTPSGCFVDDVLVHRMDGEAFLLVVNASNRDKDFSWIRSHAGGMEAEVEDVSDRTALIALQGPLAVQILTRLAGEEPSKLKRYRFLRGRMGRTEALIARTGYTGEDGFEIYLAPDEAPAIWNALLEAGRGDGLIPAGLGARDTLRLEAKMALYGNDIDETTSVLEADLGWIIGWEKGDFVGREALARQREEGTKRTLVGFELADRGIPRHGYPILVGGREAGAVTSGTMAPFLKKPIGLAYMPAGSERPGTRFEVVIRDKPVAAEVVPTPFYKRPATRAADGG